MVAEITKVDRAKADELWGEIFSGWEIEFSADQKERIAQALANFRKQGMEIMRDRAFKVCQGEVRVHAEDAGPDERPTDRIAYAKKNVAAWLMNAILALPLEPPTEEGRDER